MNENLRLFNSFEHEVLITLMGMTEEKRNVVLELLRMPTTDNELLREDIYTKTRSITPKRTGHHYMRMQGYMDALKHVPCDNGYTYDIEITRVADVHGRFIVDYTSQITKDMHILSVTQCSVEIISAYINDLSYVRHILITNVGKKWETHRSQIPYLDYLQGKNDLYPDTFTIPIFVSTILQYISDKGSESKEDHVLYGSLWYVCDKMEQHTKLSPKFMQYIDHVHTFDHNITHRGFIFLDNGFLLKFGARILVFGKNKQGQFYKTTKHASVYKRYMLLKNLQQ